MVSPLFISASGKLMFIIEQRTAFNGLICASLFEVIGGCEYNGISDLLVIERG